MASERCRTIAVLTSGGDSPGMNAGIRSVVRAALTKGWKVFFIHEGWQGLMEGKVEPALWSSVSHMMQQGGTVLGTARSQDFRTPQGRKEACFHLASRRIDGLVCIGGDGSLTGASFLRTEWESHVKALQQENRLQGEVSVSLDIVGMIGSIDCDVIGFTQTIGADSALHRIIHSVDCITSTAVSHGRTFIIEVMGRACGYLALAAAMVCGADWVFIPECAPDADSWPDDLCRYILSGREMQRKKSIIVLAEGAVDSKGKKITADDVKSVIEKKLKHDTRVTTLGHVQRGGTPSAFDRFQSTVLGVAAVDLLATQSSASVIVGMAGYSVVAHDLLKCVADTQAVGKALEQCRFRDAFAMRGSAFREFWEIFSVVSGPLQVPRGKEASFPVAVATVGAPAPGMNHCIRVLVRLLIGRGHKVYLVRGGFEGMEEGTLEEANWMSCSGWSSAGGAFLGTGRKVPSVKRSIPAIRDVFTRFALRGLVLVGGFEAYVGARTIQEHLPALSIAVVPATISLNVPGTHVSIGMDKASNNLLTACDNIKQSCIGYQKRVFVVESIGRSCGFQSLFGAVASGADLCFVPERSPSLQSMNDAVNVMRSRFSGSNAQIGLIINSETSSDVFTTNFIRVLHENALADLNVSAREALLAGIQQGGDPSPMDRIFSGRLAFAAADHITRCCQEGIVSSVSCGLIRDERHYTQLDQVDQLIDVTHRRPVEQFWLDPMSHVFNSVSFPPKETQKKGNL